MLYIVYYILHIIKLPELQNPLTVLNGAHLLLNKIKLIDRFINYCLLPGVKYGFCPCLIIFSCIFQFRSLLLLKKKNHNLHVLPDYVNQQPDAVSQPLFTSAPQPLPVCD